MVWSVLVSSCASRKLVSVLNTNEMKVTDYYFDLPQEQIAQDPLEDRSSSRLLVLNKETGEYSHHIFREITDFLKPGDCLVLNNTKVIPARLFGEKEGTQAKIEILLLKRKENDVWETLVKPGKKAKVGTKIIFGGGLLVGEVVDIVEEGNRLIKFTYEGIFEEILDQLGQMPLPPYITHQLKDKNRYQTVYAKYDGSAAAPTAGLHFTPELLQKDKRYGRRDRRSNTACRTWYFSSGKSGQHSGSSYAFRILYGDTGSSRQDQQCKEKRTPCDLCRNYKLPYH